MTTEQRRERALSILRECGSLTLKQMQEWHPDISAMTLRRDLKALEDSGAAIRTRGGAVYAGREAMGVEAAYSVRLDQNIEQKRLIARMALALAEPGRSLYLDSGTTVMALARILPDENYAVVTSGPNTALEVARRLRPTVTLLGGQLSRANLTTSGALASEWLEKLNIDVAFLATSGYSSQGGFTSGVAAECELKRAIIAKARRKIMLMDLSKLDRLLPYTFARLGDIDALICDAALPDDFANAAREAGVELIYGTGNTE